MKKATIVIFLLAFVVVLAGAQQVKYDSYVLYFDLTSSTATSIDEKLDFYLGYGYTIASTAVWGDTLIVFLQGRK